MRTLIELLYGSIALKEQALSSNIFSWAQDKAVGFRDAEGLVTGIRATGRWKQGRLLRAKSKSELDLFETGTKNNMGKLLKRLAQAGAMYFSVLTKSSLSR